jgi:Ca2+:H+ antiporter
MKYFLKPGINWLAVFIPISFGLACVPGLHNELALFATSLLGMMVVSAWIGDATEQLANRIGPTWGGMLNAAFGNLPELIFGLIAIGKGLGPLVKAAWTGAVISNLLVVIGSAMVAGGIRHGNLKFQVERANDASASMLIAAVAVLLPSIYAQARDIMSTQAKSSNFVEDISLWISALLLVAYVAGIIRTVLASKQEDIERDKENAKASEPGEDGDAWSVQFAGGVLGVASFLIALLSDYVSDSVDAVKSNLGWTDLFIGVIVIALIGNMAALFSAVKMARKNQMDLSFEIGMSAGAQISLLVVPMLVIASRWLGHPVDAQFSIPEVASIFGTILITTQIAQDGRANWLNGVQMLILYAMIAVMFFYLPG